MTQRTRPAAPGTPCWLNLASPDIQASVDFYTGLFGWQAIDQGEAYGHHHVFYKDGERVAGLGKAPDGVPSEWTILLASADVTSTREAIVAAGGSVVMGPAQVGEMGSTLVAIDPVGARFGVWQGGANLGSALPAWGTPVWWELYTLGFAKATAFYTEVFGASFQMMADTDDFRYGQMMVDGEVVAGVMDRERDMPAGQGSYWQAYIAVPDVDARTQLAVKLGGTIMQEPFDSPFGRLAYIKDATGAGLTIITTPVPPPNS